MLTGLVWYKISLSEYEEMINRYTDRQSGEIIEKPFYTAYVSTQQLLDNLCNDNLLNE